VSAWVVGPYLVDGDGELVASADGHQQAKCLESLGLVSEVGDAITLTKRQLTFTLTRESVNRYVWEYTTPWSGGSRVRGYGSVHDANGAISRWERDTRPVNS